MMPKATLWERVRDSPLTVAVSFLTVVGGVNLALAASSLDITHPTVIAGLAILDITHPAVIAGLAVLAVAAGVLTILGLFWRGEGLTGWAIQKVGLAFGASTWAINAVLMAVYAPSLAILTSLAIAGALVIRAVGVHRRSRSHLIALREAVNRAQYEEGGER